MSDTPPPMLPAGLSGKVITVTNSTGQDQTGSYVKGRNVTYQLSSGDTGTVFVPEAQFSSESVQAAVVADAQKLYAVKNLTFGG